MLQTFPNDKITYKFLIVKNFVKLETIPTVTYFGHEETFMFLLATSLKEVSEICLQIWNWIWGKETYTNGDLYNYVRHILKFFLGAVKDGLQPLLFLYG